MGHRPFALAPPTKDPATIRAYWERNPNANIGIATGEGSNLFVVSVRPGRGLRYFNLLMTANGVWTPGVEALSPTGAWDIYFRWPKGGGVRNSKNKVGPGIRVMGERGWVLAPPSIVPGYVQPYQWKNPPEAYDDAECPAWLLRLVRGGGAK